MPFYTWLAESSYFKPELWNKAVESHNNWLKQLNDLAPATIISSRPVNVHHNRFNEGFLWDQNEGYKFVHRKYYLPDSKFFWEAKWYQRGNLDFSLYKHKNVNIGMMICTDIWFTEHARKYAKRGIHILACPRATPDHSVFGVVKSQKDIWVAAGRVAARMSGAFCLSSNWSGNGKNGLKWEGWGWIIHPTYGQVLAKTDDQNPFITIDINLKDAEKAKTTYPRYVKE